MKIKCTNPIKLKDALINEESEVLDTNDANNEVPESRPLALENDKTVVEGTGKLDFGEYELAFWDLRYKSILRGRRMKSGGAGNDSISCRVFSFIRPACVPVTIVLTLSLLILFLSLLDSRDAGNANQNMVSVTCPDSCTYDLVETIPENLTYSDGSVKYSSIYSAWVTLLEDAKESVDIAAFYWTLLNTDVTPKLLPSAALGEDIFRRINDTGLNKNVKIRIAQNKPSSTSPQKDSAILQENGAAEVRSLDFDRIIGAGILHTKMWVVDGQHLYVGSANMDWRALSQVKEVGILIRNCSCLAQDLQKIFEVYWYLGAPDAEIPEQWPEEYQTQYNKDNQMSVSLSDNLIQTYLSSSPPPFSPDGRSDDIDAIVDIINKAKKFVYIAVMDYFPRLLYGSIKYWPVIDDSLRRAALDRRVHIKLLASHWNHTRSDMAQWLNSLQALTSIHYPKMTIETRLFVVPAFNEDQREIPFARVNHNKYMVTDNTAYIGTSNWSGDYFINTGGVGLVVNETLKASTTSNNSSSDSTEEPKPSLRAQLESLFERDWNSEYAHDTKQFL